MLIDLHTHSFPKSDDSHISPEQLVQEAKNVGLQGLCLTDHDGFWTPKEVERLSKDHNFLIMPGCEITTEEGHLLVYGLSNYIFGMHRASFVKALVDEVGGAIVVAHPYRRKYREEEDRNRVEYASMLDRACDSEVFSMINAVEVFNGRGSEKENRFSLDISARFELPATGASDAHNIEDIGTYCTEFSGDINSLEDLIHELRSGRYSPVVMDRKKHILKG